MRKILFYFTAVIISIVSCQRQKLYDNNALNSHQIQNAKNYVTEEIKKAGGLVATVEINKRIPMSYVDLEGHTISRQVSSSRFTLTKAIMALSSPK